MSQGSPRPSPLDPFPAPRFPAKIVIPEFALANIRDKSGKRADSRGVNARFRAPQSIELPNLNGTAAPAVLVIGNTPRLQVGL